MMPTTTEQQRQYYLDFPVVEVEGEAGVVPGLDGQDALPHRHPRDRVLLPNRKRYQAGPFLATL